MGTTEEQMKKSLMEEELKVQESQQHDTKILEGEPLVTDLKKKQNPVQTPAIKLADAVQSEPQVMPTEKVDQMQVREPKSSSKKAKNDKKKLELEKKLEKETAVRTAAEEILREKENIRSMMAKHRINRIMSLDPVDEKNIDSKHTQQLESDGVADEQLASLRSNTEVFISKHKGFEGIADDFDNSADMPMTIAKNLVDVFTAAPLVKGMLSVEHIQKNPAQMLRMSHALMQMETMEKVYPGVLENLPEEYLRKWAALRPMAPIVQAAVSNAFAKAGLMLNGKKIEGPLPSDADFAASAAKIEAEFDRKYKDYRFRMLLTPEQQTEETELQRIEDIRRHQSERKEPLSTEDIDFLLGHAKGMVAKSTQVGTTNPDTFGNYMVHIGMRNDAHSKAKFALSQDLFHKVGSDVKRAGRNAIETRGMLEKGKFQSVLSVGVNFSTFKAELSVPIEDEAEKQKTMQDFTTGIYSMSEVYLEAFDSAVSQDATKQYIDQMRQIYASSGEIFRHHSTDTNKVAAAAFVDLMLRSVTPLLTRAEHKDMDEGLSKLSTSMQKMFNNTFASIFAMDTKLLNALLENPEAVTETEVEKFTSKMPILFEGQVLDEAQQKQHKEFLAQFTKACLTRVKSIAELIRSQGGLGTPPSPPVAPPPVAPPTPPT